MENQLELTELRKAQAELNDAFSFRRSINTDEMADAFEGNSFSEKTAAAEAAAAAATATAASATASEEGTTKKKKRLVRRKKKKVVEEEEEEEPVQEEQLDLDRQIAMEYPDLDLLEEEESTSPEVAAKISEEDKLRAERMERLSGGSSSDSSDTPDWFTASEEEIASKILDDNPTPTSVDPALEAYEKNRFQSQLSAEDWNAQIMANEDKLSPLSMVMQRLAILEEEKNAADRRLEEEYERRMANEDKYYLEKRRVLEDAIEDIQRDAFTAGDETKEEDAVSSGGGPKFSA
jgi:hypothetical protein